MAAIEAVFPTTVQIDLAITDEADAALNPTSLTCVVDGVTYVSGTAPEFTLHGTSPGVYRFVWTGTRAGNFNAVFTMRWTRGDGQPGVRTINQAIVLG